MRNGRGLIVLAEQENVISNRKLQVFVDKEMYDYILKFSLKNGKISMSTSARILLSHGIDYNKKIDDIKSNIE